MVVKAWYPDEFQEFWRLYDPPANASKKKAYAAYKKAADIPDHALLMQCVVAYNEFLKANSRPNNPYPKCHASTWLSQSRFEGFLDRAEELLRAQKSASAGKDASLSVSAATWPEAVLKALRLSEPVLKAWILPCVLKLGNPPEIIAPKQFHANWLLSHFPQNLERALGGDYRVTYP